mmetsp:Transcript_6702/g.20297  ORF Transcript_6702/g.20297 Transcript_6702/m.20297 type:complete len:236 (-) Transcript_6702:1104-1811(-)
MAFPPALDPPPPICDKRDLSVFSMLTAVWANTSRISMLILSKMLLSSIKPSMWRCMACNAQPYGRHEWRNLAEAACACSSASLSLECERKTLLAVSAAGDRTATPAGRSSAKTTSRSGRKDRASDVIPLEMRCRRLVSGSLSAELAEGFESVDARLVRAPSESGPSASEIILLGSRIPLATFTQIDASSVVAVTMSFLCRLSGRGCGAFVAKVETTDNMPSTTDGFTRCVDKATT